MAVIRFESVINCPFDNHKAASMLFRGVNLICSFAPPAISSKGSLAICLKPKRRSKNQITFLFIPVFNKTVETLYRMIRNNQLSCIGNHTFAGMSTIRHLSLYGNQVSTVLAGAFSSMTSLSTLYVYCVVCCQQP